MAATTGEAGIFGFSDAARKISDAANQALVNGRRDEWLAFGLSDGAVEGMPDSPRTYPYRQDAVRAQGHAAANHGYLQVPWDGVTARAAEVFLKLGRQLRDIGHELVDPEVANRSFIPSNVRESFPSLDRRRVLARGRRHIIRQTPGGLYLP